MQIEKFMNYVKQYKIPPNSPDGTTPHGINFLPDIWETHRDARDECVERGMWAIVYQAFAQSLASWIDGRKVLEIMAGAGWLAKALQDEGCTVVATDSGDWNERHSKQVFLTDVVKVEATEAIKQHPDAEILLISWPPYGEQAVVDACQAWGPGRPIIYIGESDGGCNAPEEFFAHFKEMSDPPDIDVMSWEGLHDHAVFGYWKT